ncbi:MAG TPA: hypothetical protein VN673_19130 [Clostridia bacterium]|nr:hypothetical protein [Clostridia bacterium]
MSQNVQVLNGLNQWQLFRNGTISAPVPNTDSDALISVHSSGSRFSWSLALVWLLSAGCAGHENRQSGSLAMPSKERQKNHLLRTDELRPDAKAKELKPITSGSQLLEALNGTWTAREFSSDMPEFFGVTNVTLTVLWVYTASTNREATRVFAYLNARLTMLENTGKELPAPSSSPVELEGDRITFGIPPSGYSFRFVLQADSLLLDRESSGEHFKARLVKVTRPLSEKK